jgi:hypothetical protein
LHKPYQGTLWGEINDLRNTIAWCRVRTHPARKRTEIQRCEQAATLWVGYIKPLSNNL